MIGFFVGGQRGRLMANKSDQLASKTGGLFVVVKKELTLFKERRLCLFSHLAYIFTCSLVAGAGRMGI